MLSQKNDNKVQQIILLEGLANLAVFVVKLIVGITTGSLAIIGDAIHSLSDLTNNIIVWFVIKHSYKPADKEHPYGHRKFETLAVLGLSFLLALLAFELVFRAFDRETVEIGSSNWELGLMIGVLIINISIASWEALWAKRLDSDILHADASHTFVDVLTTIVVIAGWQLSSMGYVWLDQLTAIAVAMLILYIAWGLFKKATPVLVDEYSVEPEQVTALVMKIKGVKDVDRIRSRWIGQHPSVDMVIFVDKNLSTLDAHEICDQIELAVESEFDVHDVSIHVEPY
ncbi:MAG: cation diffusion facilitator family transporter [Gammaproteobacteria bacterium]|nr:cation diffusion facilitator family transporter [Gammaproteobacteria bacterium]MDH5629131.1 cation diffusion facilitator family transporter [Gammaproteobacteria bacterium]